MPACLDAKAAIDCICCSNYEFSLLHLSCWPGVEPAAFGRYARGDNFDRTSWEASKKHGDLCVVHPETTSMMGLKLETEKPMVSVDIQAEVRWWRFAITHVRLFGVSTSKKRISLLERRDVSLQMDYLLCRTGLLEDTQLILSQVGFVYKEGDLPQGTGGIWSERYGFTLMRRGYSTMPCFQRQARAKKRLLVKEVPTNFNWFSCIYRWPNASDTGFVRRQADNHHRHMIMTHDPS